MAVKNLLNLVGDKLHTLPLVILYLTDGCNSRCITCDIWRNPRRNMHMDLVETIVEECSALRVRWVLLSGGEAMQHPHWPEIARRFHESGIYVMLLTNGLLLRKQADALRGSVDEVIVSLDGGTQDTYKAIRGVDAFDVVLDGMRAARDVGLPVITRTTVQHANFREIPRIIDVAQAAGATRVSFLAADVSNAVAFGPRFENDGSLQFISNNVYANPVILTEGEIADLSLLLDDVAEHYKAAFESGLMAESPAKLRRILVDYFRVMAGLDSIENSVRPRCNAPHLSTVIEVDGTLRPCYFLPQYGTLESNGAGRKVTLKSALNSDLAVSLRRAYRAGERKECERCVCPLHKGPKAVLRM